MVRILDLLFLEMFLLGRIFQEVSAVQIRVTILLNKTSFLQMKIRDT